MGECTSEGNKFNHIKYVDTDESIFPEKQVTEYDLTFENIFHYLRPLYDDMKQGNLYEEHKYIVKDGIAMAYVEGRQRYENMNVQSIESESNNYEYPPVDQKYAMGPLEYITNSLKEDDFDSNWFNVLRPVGRTLWGTEIPSRTLCDVEINKDGEGKTITYTLNKKSQEYKSYFNTIENNSKRLDLS